MEGVALQEARFGGLAFLRRLLIEGGDALERGDDVRAEGFPVADGLRREEAAAQHLGHVLLEHRLDALLTLAAEDGVELLGELLA